MRRTLFARRRLLAGLTATTLLGPAAVTAQQPPAAPSAAPGEFARVDKNTGAVLVPLGSVVRYDTKATKLPVDLLVRDDSVAGVRLDPANPKIIVLTGRQSGATEVTVTFEDKTKQLISVLVQPDLDLLRKTLRQTIPTANVEVQPGVGGTVIVSGYVNKPEDADLVTRIASAAVGGNLQNVINAVQVGGAQHVLIDVTVAQVDRTELRERGFSFGIQGTQGGGISVLPGLATNGLTDRLFAGASVPVIVPTSQANLLVAGIAPSSYVAALRALKTEGVARFLSEPKVITQSGRPALLRAGGQQATLSPAAGINGPGVVLEQVGTQLEVLPIVFGNGKIYLEVTPQFRSVNVGRGVTTSFGFSPGFNESSVRSSVYLESGQTYAIGGLLETQAQTTLQKVPYVGDLPFIGAAFSNIVSDERETELLILVTPRLVDALDCTQVPKRVPGKETRVPDDYELFLESIIEAPRGQRQVFVNGRYVAAYKNSPTAGQYPCIGPDGKPGTCATPQFTPMTPVTPVFGGGYAKDVTPVVTPPVTPAAAEAPATATAEAPVVTVPAAGGQ